VQRRRLELDALGKRQVVGLDPLENVLIEVHQIHLVDGYDDVLDAQQRGDEAVALGLSLHAIAGIDQNDRQVAGGRPGGHVAGVLLVAGGIGNDELALRRGEITVGHIDGDALLTLGLQAIDQQRQIDVLASGTDLLRIASNGLQMILIDHLRVMQQAADQRALAVVDVAAGEETQELLALVLRQVREDVLADQIGLVTHDAFP
jgi:hypothetical protein